MKPIVFVGSNANILQMVDNAQSNGRKVAGIIDADYYNNTTDIDGVPVIGSELDWNWSLEYDYFLATSWVPYNKPLHQRNKQKRFEQINLLESHRVQCINLIHKSAIIPPTCNIGTGVMIGAYAVLGNHVTVGDYAQVREQSYLAHSASIGANSTVQVQAYIGRDVQLGEYCYIGVRASIVPAQAEPIQIDDNTFIKSNTMVTRS